MEGLGDIVRPERRTMQPDKLKRLSLDEPPANLDEAGLTIERECREIASSRLHLQLMNRVELQEMTQEGATDAAAMPRGHDYQRRNADARSVLVLNSGDADEFSIREASEELLCVRPDLLYGADERREVGGSNELGLRRIRSHLHRMNALRDWRRAVIERADENARVHVA